MGAKDYLINLFSEAPSPSSTRFTLVFSHIAAFILSAYAIYKGCDLIELSCLIAAWLAPVDALKAAQKFAEMRALK